MTRIALLSLLLLTLPSCSVADPGNPGTENTEMSWRILASGGSSRVASAGSAAAVAPRVEIARSNDEFERLWSQLIGEEMRPPAALDEESVVFLLADTRPTGGFELDPRDVQIEGSRLIINAEVKGPPPGGMVTQAITAPWAVVAVNRREFAEVQWVEDGQLVARKAPADQAQ